MESEVNQVNICSLSFLDAADVISEHRRRGGGGQSRFKRKQKTL